MKWLLGLVAAVFSLQAPASLAAEAWLSMVYTNALHEELPFSIFSDGGWSPDPKARFVKLHLYFDEPVLVRRVEIDDCGSEIRPDISVFFNFDQWIVSGEPGTETAYPASFNPKRENGLLIVKAPEEGIDVRSLTFNFESNSGFRICGINFKDPDGRQYDVKIPALAGGGVASASVLLPISAYDPIFLFDSRFEYGWASNKKAKDVSLDFKFDMPRRVEKIRIWNGYQRSVTHCAANSRARTVRVTGDGGYTADITVKDILGSQVVALPKPFLGKNLKFHIVDSYAGKSYKDLVISEIRFFDGKGWFMLDPTAPLKSAIATNRAAFVKAGVADMLNDSYAGYGQNEKTYFSTRLRLRADGSFFLSGAVGMLGAEGGAEYFALGNYEIKKSSAAGGMRLRIFGLYNQTEIYGDCNGCGRDCNKSGLPEGVAAQKIFQEYVTLKPDGNGGFAFVNESGGKKLPFKALVMKREDAQ